MSRYVNEAAIARDALAIWDGGACNPRGVGRALVEAIDWYVENKGGTDGCRKQAPIAVMQGQLLFLLGYGIGDLPSNDVDQYLAACRRLVEQI